MEFKEVINYDYLNSTRKYSEVINNKETSNNKKIGIEDIGLILIFIIFIYFIFLFKKSTKKKKNFAPSIPVDDQEILNKCYQVYHDIQDAYIDFDYDALHELVTDKLFNSYQTKIEELKYKDEKKVMTNFGYGGGHIINIFQKDGFDCIEVEINVAFYDYIVDKSQKIVKGTDKNKVLMTYNMVFEIHKELEDKCFNCGEKVEANTAICPHCNTPSPNVNKKLKLAKQKTINKDNL